MLLPNTSLGNDLYSAKVNGVIISDITCRRRMEEAMRVMDKYLVPISSSYNSYNGCNHCSSGDDGSGNCTLLACSDGPTRDLARLEWEVEQKKKQIKFVEERTEALKVWAEAKRECWQR